MIESWALFAQQPPAAAPGGSSASFLVQLIPFLPLIVLFYFFMIRPQQRQERQRKSMLDALKKNDKVLTNGGIIGTVMSLDPAREKVVLRIDDDKGVRCTFSRAYIVRVIEADKDTDSGKSGPLPVADAEGRLDR